jgi:hypothetical protein
MADQPDYLNEFLSRIAPYQSYWRSLKFACMAARVGSDWVQFAGEARLSTEPSEPNSTLKRILDLQDFRAYAGRLEAKKIQNLISNLKTSAVISGFIQDSVLLAPRGSQSYSWQPSFVNGRRGGASHDQGWPSALTVYGTGDRPYSFVPQILWRDIDTQLRRHNPPYNGLDSLCTMLDLEFKQSSSISYFKLCAELPARFRAGQVNRKEKSLTLSMEYVGTPELIIEWLPEHPTKKESVPIGDPEKPGRFEITVPIPMGVTGIKARLLTVEADADQLSLRVDWENILLRICEFFDPSQTKLADFLFSENSLKNVNPFELGIARLLGLAGYTALWFGKGAKDALPDVVAYVRHPLGAERIIYAECTLKNPAEKFSDLANRADDLRTYLGLEAGTILPVVFVRNDATAQDREAAGERRLVVCGGADIRKLQDKIKSDATADDVFQFLRSLSSLTLIPGGLLSRFV